MFGIILLGSLKNTNISIIKLNIPICLHTLNVRATAKVCAVTSVYDFRSPETLNWQMVNFSIFLFLNSHHLVNKSLEM